MEMDKVWLGKKVFIRLKLSKKVFQGNIIEEDTTSITILDKFHNRVKLSFDEISLLQEEI